LNKSRAILYGLPICKFCEANAGHKQQLRLPEGSGKNLCFEKMVDADKICIRHSLKAQNEVRYIKKG
jgi:hypothetical protein